METHQYLFTIYKDALFVKLLGNITYVNSYPFEVFSQHIFEDPKFKAVLIDLSETTGIDSTNLGILARIGVAARSLSGAKASLISTSPDVTRTLESMGFEQVFSIVNTQPPKAALLKPLPPVIPNKKTSLAEAILGAHKELMAINKQNEKTFSSVVDFMEKDIEKLNKRKQPPE